jgi:hypothetical protein
MFPQQSNILRSLLMLKRGEKRKKKKNKRGRKRNQKY